MALVGGATPAVADQLQVRDEPTHYGPLSLLQKKCARQTESYRRQEVAVVKSCLYFYAFNPQRETDGNRNYGVAWLQSSVNSKNGWCTLKVASNIRTSPGFRVHDTSPRDRTVARKTFVRTKVTADAQGHSDAVGVVRKGFLLYPRSIDKMLIERDGGGHVLRLKWTGTEARELGFALGAEVSWNQSAGPLTDLSIDSSLQYDFQRRDRC